MPSLNSFTDVKVITLVLGTICVLGLTKLINLETEDALSKLKANISSSPVSETSESSIHLNLDHHHNHNHEFELSAADDPETDQRSKINFYRERESSIVKHEDEHLNHLQYRLPGNLVPFKYHIKLRPVIPSVPIPPRSSNKDKDEVNSKPYVDEIENDAEIQSQRQSQSQSQSQSQVDSAEIQSQNPSLNLNESAFNYSPFKLFTVPGSVIVSFECVEATNKIVLHAQNITVDEERVQVLLYDEKEDESFNFNSKGEAGFKIAAFEYDHIQEFFTIILQDNLQAGVKYSVSIAYTAILLRQDSMGVFTNTYHDQVTNTTRFMVGTKFQATHARKAFPCFDEPALKAVFYISLGRREEYHTLSNAPLNHTTLDSDHPGWLWDHYQPSMRMSTYLVCFAVSEYSSQPANPALLTNGRAIQVWAPKHFIDKGGGIFAADWTASVVAYLENYFNRSDCLPKVDSIMVPQFTTSAMENWGLITYKELMLIYVPNENTEYRKSLVSTVVAHELSHHWFGNLVTCRWWSDIWLNEGFATYLSYMVLESLRPEMDAHHEFVNDVLELSMRSDPKLTTDPVRNTARNQYEIDNAFSRTSYRKGASMVHMMKNFLGESLLQRGLQNFVGKYAYGNVSQDDLFEELNLVGTEVLPEGLTVKQIMDTWTLKSGYPIVRVYALNQTAIKISQETFRLATLDREMKDGEESGERWWVPVKITSRDPSKIYPSTWIPVNSTSIVYTEKIDTTQWLLVNPEFAGYYLVLYDKHLTALIKNQLDNDHTVFSAVTRSQMFFSYICAASANYIRKETALELLTYLGKETDFVVWNTVFPFVGELSRRLLGSLEYHDALTNFFVPRIESVLQSPEVGLYPSLTRTEKPTTMFFRTELLSLACQLDSIVCMSDPGFYHKLTSTGQNSHILTTHVEEMMLCALVKSGGEPLWEFALEKYQNETQDYVQWWYMKALTCTYSPDLILRTLDVISNVSLHAFPSNRPAGLHHLATNKYALGLTFNYLLENFGVNATLVTPDVFSATIATLSHFIYKQQDITRLRKFIVENRESLSRELSSLGQSLMTMEENMVWMEFHGKTYATWFQQNTPSKSNLPS